MIINEFILTRVAQILLGTIYTIQN